MLPTQGQETNLFWKCAEYILYVFLALFPFVNYGSFLYMGTATRSINLILFTSLIGIFYVGWVMVGKEKIRILKSPILAAIGVYFLCLVISALGGLSFSNSWWSVITRTTGLWYFIHLGFYLLLLVGLLSDPVRRNKIVLVTIVATALYSLCALLSPQGLNVLFIGYVNDGFTLGNSTFAAMYVLGALLLSLYYIFQAKIKKWWMSLIPFALVIHPDIINPVIWLGDFSKGILGEAQITSYAVGLSFVGLVLVWLISCIKDIRLKTKVAYSAFGLLILVGIFFAISLLSPGGSIRGAYLERSTAARPLVWELSQIAIEKKLWFGWGTDNFERVFEQHFDNRLLQDEYGNEAWFDRAHNVFIDQLVDNGVIGLLAYLTLYLVTLWCLIYAALHSLEKRDRLLSSILVVYVTLHFLELQTAFDTSISYPMTIMVIALAANLFYQARGQRKGKEYVYTLPMWVRYGVVSVVGIFLLWSFFWGWVPFVRAQMANGAIRTVGNSVARLPFYSTLFNSPVDEHAFLWRTMTDFQRGIGQKPSILNDPQKVVGLKKEAALFTQKYEEYVDAHPTHFRAHLNLADILIYQRLFEVDKLAQAQEVLDRAIELVPTSPQPYWMKAVAYVYMKKFDLAREYAKKGLELNPNIVQSQEVVTYVEKSIKNFPNIDLFFFKQI